MSHQCRRLKLSTIKCKKKKKKKKSEYFSPASKKHRFLKAPFFCHCRKTFCQQCNTNQVCVSAENVTAAEKMTIIKVKIRIIKFKEILIYKSVLGVWNALCNKLLPSVGRRCYLHWLRRAVSRLSEEAGSEKPHLSPYCHIIWREK